ncbi:ATP-binding protein [Pectinatus frisingensis]|uniref:ATP-binding protein n=1 Tax=Pectinatus frisingensis TaxID=865 RepID=UPI0018C4D145|nr:ATP-binding protein [Pectinatus frisingensis]
MQAIADIIEKREYRATYDRMKKAGRIKAPTIEHYKCSKCKDTGYITIIGNDGSFSKAPCKCLEQMRIESRLKKSGISPADYALYNFNTFKSDTAEHTAMKQLAMKYLNSHITGQGIGFFGNSGTGKTHICIAICQALTRQYGEEHYYFSYRSEIQRIKAVMYDDGGKYSQAIQHWTMVNNLYIDDLFKFAERDGKMQQQDLQIVFDIINTRYINHKATIFSSEKTVNDIKDIDEALGSRIFSMINPFGMACKDGNMRLVK